MPLDGVCGGGRSKIFMAQAPNSCMLYLGQSNWSEERKQTQKTQAPKLQGGKNQDEISSKHKRTIPTRGCGRPWPCLPVCQTWQCGMTGFESLRNREDLGLDINNLWMRPCCVLDFKMQQMRPLGFHCYLVPSHPHRTD